MSQLHPIQPPVMSRVDNSKKTTPSFIYFTIAASKLTLGVFLSVFIGLNYAAPEPESISQEKQAVSVDVRK